MTALLIRLLAIAIIALAATAGARAETPEEWVALGARVHGAFGSFIPMRSSGSM